MAPNGGRTRDGLGELDEAHLVSAAGVGLDALVEAVRYCNREVADFPGYTVPRGRRKGGSGSSIRRIGGECR